MSWNKTEFRFCSQVNEGLGANIQLMCSCTKWKKVSKLIKKNVYMVYVMLHETHNALGILPKAGVSLE